MYETPAILCPDFYRTNHSFLRAHFTRVPEPVSSLTHFAVLFNRSIEVRSNCELWLKITTRLGFIRTPMHVHCGTFLLVINKFHVANLLIREQFLELIAAVDVNWKENWNQNVLTIKNHAWINSYSKLLTKICRFVKLLCTQKELRDQCQKFWITYRQISYVNNITDPWRKVSSWRSWTFGICGNHQHDLRLHGFVCISSISRVTHTGYTKNGWHWAREGTPPRWP